MSYNANHYDARAGEDIVDVLTAISVVSKRLASNLTAARQQSKSREGGKSHEQRPSKNSAVLPLLFRMPLTG